MDLDLKDSLEIKEIAKKIADTCGYLKELQMLESLYPRENYLDFLDLLRIHAFFALDNVEVSKGFSTFFDENVEFFKKWLENEDFEIGRESVLSFLEMDLKISFDDFLNGAKEVKERVVQGFVYSASCALYSYLNELFRKI